MLGSFEIINFRLFQHLTVKKLSRVNLIVGKNNCGKSSFLEALQLYASDISPTTLFDLLESRQDDWLSGAQSHAQSLLENAVRHLFFNHKFPKTLEEGISLGEVSSKSNPLIGTAVYQNVIDEEGTMSRIRISEEELMSSDAKFFLVAAEFVLEVKQAKITRKLFDLNTDIRDIRDIKRKSRFFYERELEMIWQIVPTKNMSDRKLAALWDLTGLTDLESEVISALRLIDHRVTRVAFVEDISKGQTSDNRIPIVKLEGVEEPLPLKSMGDGMMRLFHIILALVNARNGILLIDEFENGLHWSVQPQIWNIVFQVAEKLNVQVFATTHSRDCIAGFDQAWNNYPDLGAFLRLDLKDGNVKATEYTSETLTDAIEMDVEVR